MKILVTGFEPFGQETINPSFEAVKLLPKCIGGAEVVTAEIAVEFEKSKRQMDQLIQKHNPDVVVAVGQAGGRGAVTVERVAINLTQDRFVADGVVEEDGENAYFTTLPFGAIVKNCKEQGVKCMTSLSAGSYVCNSVMYYLLYKEKKQNLGYKAGFIHVPFIPCQTEGKTAMGGGGVMPSMPLEEIAKALQIACQTIASGEQAQTSERKEF